MSISNLTDDAKKLAEQGFHIFPCKPNQKIPATPHGCKDATDDPAKINGQYIHGRNIAIATGHHTERGYLAVIDFDTTTGADEFQAENLPFPKTVCSITPRGGSHWYFFFSREVKNSQGVLAPKVDVRGTGGYVLCSPSTVNGKAYQWENSPEEIQIAEAPAWLEALICIPDAPPRPAPRPTTYSAADAGSHWLQKALAKATEGNRNATGLWLATQLRDAGLSENAARGVMRQYAAGVPQGGTRYLTGEALASAKSAYSRAARNPAVSAPGADIPTQPDRTPPDAPGNDDPMFYGLAGDIVRTISPQTEAADVALLVHLIIMIGNVAGRGPHCIIDGARHGTNEYAVFVGATSKGRKGTALAQVKKLMDGVDDTGWMSECLKSGCSSGEGLIWVVRDEIKREVQIKTRGKFTGETQTEIADFGVADKRLMAIESEFSRVLKASGRDGCTLSEQLRLGWDTGDLHILTKNPVKATGAHISMIAHITAGELTAKLSECESINGFGNRYLWVYVTRSKLLPFGGDLSDADLAPLRERLREVLTFAATVEEMDMTSAAKQIWAPAYVAMSEGHAGRYGTMTDRGEAHIRRLANIYALMDMQDAVDVPHLRAAMALWSYCDATAEYLFPERDEEGKIQNRPPEQNSLVSIIQRFGGRITPRELCRASRKHQPNQKAEAELELLVSQGLATVQFSAPGVTGGKPAKFYVLASADALTVDNTSLGAIKNASYVNVNTVNTLENENPQPPDYDPVPADMQEQNAEAELARQAQVSEADV